MLSNIKYNTQNFINYLRSQCALYYIFKKKINGRARVFLQAKTTPTARIRPHAPTQKAPKVYKNTI